MNDHLRSQTDTRPDTDVLLKEGEDMVSRPEEDDASRVEARGETHTAEARHREIRASFRQWLKAGMPAYTLKQWEKEAAHDLHITDALHYEAKTPRNPERVEMIASLRRQGNTYETIAKKIGISYQAVRSCIDRWHPELRNQRR